MPIYEFKCNGCDTVTEHLVSMTTTSIVCDQCRSIANKIVSAPHGTVKGGTPNYHTHSTKK